MVTISEVAQRAGVSTTTVSHVLNETRRVNPETRARVERAVEELGYRRNHAARMLAGGSSRTLGLVISGLTNTYFGPLLHAIERRASDAGYMLVLGDSHDEEAMERRVVESLLDRAVDGFIIAPSPGFDGVAAARIADAQKPLVLIDRSLDIPCDQLVPENTDSVRELTEHLIEHGHERIAAVAGLGGLDTSDARVSGYREALEHHGLPVLPDLIISGESQTAAAQESVARLLAGEDAPSAIVSLNNAMTIGTLRAVNTAGLSIPGDIAFAAYDDFEWADLFEPGITAVAQDVARMGNEAVDLLIRRLEGATSPFEHRVIGTSLRRRTSCGCPRIP